MKLTNCPDKIVYQGENHQESKHLSLPELAVLIDRDLMKVSNCYSELICHFEVKLKRFPYEYDGFEITLHSTICDVLEILKDEINKTLESYNKQILVRSNGAFRSRYCRFGYCIHFQYKKLSALKGGKE